MHPGPPHGPPALMQYCSRHARIMCLALQPEGFPTCEHTPPSDAASATRLGRLDKKHPTVPGIEQGCACPPRKI